jgi:hypothetical protein
MTLETVGTDTPAACAISASVRGVRLDRVLREASGVVSKWCVAPASRYRSANGGMKLKSCTRKIRKRFRNMLQ